MDTVLIPAHATEQQQPITPNKQTRNKTPKKNIRGSNLISNPSENLDKYAGLLNPPLHPPPSRAMSFSTFSYQQQQKQPPLLPLPHVSQIQRPLQPLLSRSLNSQGFSLPQPQQNRKNRTTKDMSLTPKKSKPTKREETKKRSGTQSISEFLISASDNHWGPEPKDLPMHLPVVLTSTRKVLQLQGNKDMFSDEVFNLSPPPSSLPLPKFSMRSKLSCNAEAVGSVDDGATNNLRRLLKLR